MDTNSACLDAACQSSVSPRFRIRNRYWWTAYRDRKGRARVPDDCREWAIAKPLWSRMFRTVPLQIFRPNWLPESQASTEADAGDLPCIACHVMKAPRALDVRDCEVMMAPVRSLDRFQARPQGKMSAGLSLLSWRTVAVMRRVLSRIPLSITAPLLLVTPALVVFAVLTMIAFVQGRTAANNLASQQPLEIHGRIDEQLTDLLKTPARSTELTPRSCATPQPVSLRILITRSWISSGLRLPPAGRRASPDSPSPLSWRSPRGPPAATAGRCGA